MRAVQAKPKQIPSQLRNGIQTPPASPTLEKRIVLACQCWETRNMPSSRWIFRKPMQRSTSTAVGRRREATIPVRLSPAFLTSGVYLLVAAYQAHLLLSASVTCLVRYLYVASTTWYLLCLGNQTSGQTTEEVGAHLQHAVRSIAYNISSHILTCCMKSTA